jgi:lipoprotein-releasing system permease protein
MISGFKKEITEKIFGFWGHIHVTDANARYSLLEAVPMDRDSQFTAVVAGLGQIEYESNVRILGREFENWQVSRRTRGGIRHIQAFALKPGIIQTRSQIEGIILKGVGQDFDWSFLKKYLVEGRVFQPGDSIAAHQILISQQTATRLNIGTGDKFIVHFVTGGEQLRRRFEVSGIFRTGLEEYDKKFALVDLAAVQDLLGWGSGQVGGFEIFVDDLSDLQVLTEFLYYQILPAKYYAETIQEKFPPIFEWLNLQNLNEVVILVLMLVVAIINMITTLLILILERTNMIGILKALGDSNWGIRKIFLHYAAYIILLGLLFGNLLGIGLCLLQKHFSLIRLSEADYYLSVAPVNLDPWTILLLNAGTLAITLVFLVVPSYLISRISPVRAIRFK